LTDFKGMPIMEPAALLSGAARAEEINGVSTLAWNFHGASDLVPAVDRHRDLRVGALQFVAFAAGAGLPAALRLLRGG
jgi:hypothetical protein